MPAVAEQVQLRARPGGDQSLEQQDAVARRCCRIVGRGKDDGGGRILAGVGIERPFGLGLGVRLVADDLAPGAGGVIGLAQRHHREQQHRKIGPGRDRFVTVSPGIERACGLIGGEARQMPAGRKTHDPDLGRVHPEFARAGADDLHRPLRVHERRACIPAIIGQAVDQLEHGEAMGLEPLGCRRAFLQQLDAEIAAPARDQHRRAIGLCRAIDPHARRRDVRDRAQPRALGADLFRPRHAAIARRHAWPQQDLLRPVLGGGHRHQWPCAGQ